MTESFLRGRLPRTYAWVRTPSGRAERVTILFDSGASHCFMSPRIRDKLGLTADQSAGPAKLLTSNEQEVQCEGEVAGVQVMMEKYRHRMSFIVADIGRDDIILGGEVLEMQEAGYGPAGSGTYKFVVHGVEYLIPLMGASEGAKRSEVKTIRGTKKILKLFRKHSTHMFTGTVRRSETSLSTDSPTVEGAATEKVGEMEQTAELNEDVLSQQERGAQSYQEGKTEEVGAEIRYEGEKLRGNEATATSGGSDISGNTGDEAKSARSADTHSTRMKKHQRQSSWF